MEDSEWGMNMDWKRLGKAVRKAAVTLLIPLVILVVLVMLARLLKWWFVALSTAALVVFVVWEEYRLND